MGLQQGSSAMILLKIDAWNAAPVALMESVETLSWGDFLFWVVRCLVAPVKRRWKVVFKYTL